MVAARRRRLRKPRTKALGRIDGAGHRITGDRVRQSSKRGKGWGTGWEALHVAIDDASRLACTENPARSEEEPPRRSPNGRRASSKAMA